MKRPVSSEGLPQYPLPLIMISGHLEPDHTRGFSCGGPHERVGIEEAPEARAEQKEYG